MYCGTSWSVLLPKYCSCYQVKKNEMGGACGTMGGGEVRIGFGTET